MTRATLADLSLLAEKSRERFEELATRFRASQRKAGPPALTEGYWQSLRELFTRDVTPEGLRQLVQHEAHETFRFLTRRWTWRTSPGSPGTSATPGPSGGSSSRWRSG